MLTIGRTRYRILGAYARNIRMLTALFDVDVKVAHTPGVNSSVAVLLSRWDTTNQSDKKLKSCVFIVHPIWVQVDS